MLDKVKALPEKVSFAIGMTLLIGNGLLLLFLSLIFPLGTWTTIIVGGLVSGIAILFILNAAEKRHSRIEKS